MKMFSAPRLVALCVLAGLPTMAAAQSVPVPETGLEAARRYFAEGRLGEARGALRGVSASAESTRLGADIALAAGDLRAALDAYDQLTGRFRTPDDELLRSIAVHRVRQLREDRDPRVRVDACGVLLAAKDPGDCKEYLNRTATSADVDAGTRIVAASVLEQQGEPGADKLLDLVIGTAVVSSPAAAAGALGWMPAARSNEPLKTLAFSDNADARYLAVRALARRRTPDVISTLRAVAADDRPRAPRLLAHIGLAGTGDANSVRVVREVFPRLDGAERLDAAVALQLARVPDAGESLVGLTTGPHEIVRLDAAEVLHATKPKEAEAVLAAGLASGNPWIKARALEAVANLGLEATAAVRRAMLDRNTSVAVAASRAVIGHLAKARRP